MALNYNKLIKYLSKQKVYRFVPKKDYFMIFNGDFPYHITVYRDQWDDYQDETNLPYHLFHITSNSEANKCSTYFWVDKKSYRTKHIPKKYFQYNQPDFGFYSSTRTSCEFKYIKPMIIVMEKMLRTFFQMEKARPRNRRF
jgi:hypothetical protein